MSGGSEAPPLPPRLKMAPGKSLALQMSRKRYHILSNKADTTLPQNLTSTQTPFNTLIIPVESWNNRASESAVSDRPRVPPGRMAGARCPRLRPRLARLRYMALSRISVSCSKQYQHITIADLHPASPHPRRGAPQHPRRGFHCHKAPQAVSVSYQPFRKALRMGLTPLPTYPDPPTLH